jgi:hypothetical protein
MPADRPPRGLPPGYAPIWRALARADAGASSRAELARRLNVSTHTLQRILVDGTPPDFRKKQGRRLVLSWVRTLARLARGLASESRPWIEGVGIRWDDQVRTAVERETVKAGGPKRPASSVREETMARIRARAAAGEPEPVRAGVVPLGPYERFFRSWVDRLVGAVEPAWGVRWVRASAEEIAAELRSGGLDVGAGLFETPALRASGLELLPAPGLRPGLRALAVRPAAGERPGPRWPELLDPDASHVLLVRDGDPAASLARRQWNLPADRVIQRRRPTGAALAEEAFAEAKRRDGTVVLLADEITVHAARAHLAAADGFSPEFETRDVRPLPDEEPRYPLGVAVGPGDALLPLLKHAQETELFGPARASTAALYADVMFDGARELLGARGAAAHAAGLVRLESFPEAGPELRRAAVRRLLATLAAEASEAEDPWARALDVARRLTPPEWRPALEQAAQALAGPSHPGPGLCRSCSASLLENRGASELYCRYCSNEDGVLRSREEVREILAHWMQQWQGGLSDEAAKERAERFMSTMPAWAPPGERV